MSFEVVDEAPITGFHRKLTAACCGGPLLDGYLLGIVGVALTGLSADLDLGATGEAVVGVAALVGMFFGGVVFGPLTDRVGRKTMYTLDLLVLIAGSALSIFVTSAWQVVVLRFVIGAAIAADYPIATALLSEWLPRRRRGQMFSYVIIIWYVGPALAYIVGYLIVEALGNEGWRWMLASSAVLAAAVYLLRLGTPESPRWLAGAGRAEEASRVIERVLAVRVDPASLHDGRSDSTQARGSLVELFRPPYLRRTAFVVVFFTCAIVPLFALLTFGPQLLGAFGLGNGNAVNLTTGLINLGFAVGCLPAMRLLETAGRRRTITWSFALMVLPLLLLGGWPTAPAAVAITALCAYALFSGAPGILEWAYPNELFPTRIRAAALGVAVALTRFGAAVGTFLVPISLTTLGVSPTMYAGAVITAIGFVACLAWAEETRGRSLEDLEAAPGSVTASAVASPTRRRRSTIAGPDAPGE